VIQLHRLLARGTVEEGKDNARRRPLVLHDLFDAVQMEHVATSKLDAGFRTQATNPTDGTVRILVSIRQKQARIVRSTSCLRILSSFPDTLCFETRQALTLTREATASVPTRQRLVAILPNHFLTFCFETNVIKGARFFVLFLVGEDVAAETALFTVLVSLVLLTVFASVVGLQVAPAAEVLVASTTPNAISTHVDGCSRRHHSACVVLCVVVNLALGGFHDGTASRALDHIVSLAHEKVHLAFFDRLQVPLRNIHFLLAH